MKYLALSIEGEASELAALEALIEVSGPVSMVIRSTSDEMGVEEIYETLPGEIRLWDRCILTAYFPLQQELEGLRKNLFDYDRSISDRVSIEFVDLEELAVNGQEQEVDKLIAGRLYLKSKKSKLENDDLADAYTLYMDPGLAFGSGQHPTTELCLEWIAESALQSKMVIDYGCGSGILGMAASVLGARSVCVDYDEQAVIATTQNAEFNDLASDRLTVFHSRAFDFESNSNRFDVLIANILALPLVDLAAEFQCLLTPSGTLVLSGILESQVDLVTDAYPLWDFKDPVSKEGWVRLVADRL